MPAVSAQLHYFIAPAAPAAKSAPKASWFFRFVDSLAQARARQAEREIAKYIQAHGARLTDDLERKIERRFI